MADLNRSFTVENGLDFAETNVVIFSDTVDPLGGLAAIRGSLLLRDTGQAYLKVNVGDTDWVPVLRGGDVVINVTQPASGLTISGGPITTSGTLTFSLANDLAGLEGITGAGFATRTSADTWTSRSLIGTTDQISIADGSGTSGNPTVAIADNPVLPGTASLTLPTGSTAQRPTATGGRIRFNSTTGFPETPVSGTWQSLVLDNDARLQPEEFVAVVNQNPAPGEFSSIAAACAFITTSSDTERWIVRVGPGVYIEPQIDVPAFVTVSGHASAEYAVAVEPDNGTHPVFSLGANGIVQAITVRNATGTGQAAFQIHNVGSYALLHKVSLANCSIGWDINSTSADSAVYLEYCDWTGDAATQVGLKMASSGGFSAYCNAENFYIYRGATNPTHGVELTGINTLLNMQAYGFEGSDDTGHGIHIQDGAQFEGKAGHIAGWNIGAHIANVGVAPTANFLATEFHGNVTWDLLAEHPGSIGTLSGTATRTKVNAGGAPLFTFAFADIANNEYIQTGDFWLGATAPTVTNVSDLIINTPPTGLLSGGEISDGGGLDVDVAAGDGYLLQSGEVARVSWSAGSITLSPGVTTYVYIDSSGVISQSSSLPDPNTTILLGRAMTGASSIVAIGREYFGIARYGNGIDLFLRDAIGPLYISGNIVTENGTTDRSLDVTDGRYMTSSQVVLPLGGTGITFLHVYQVSSALTITPETVVDNTTYLSGGDLVALTSGYFAKHTLYVAGEGADTRYFLQHADAEYATQQQAENAPLATPLIDPGLVPHIATIIVQQGASAVVAIQDIRPRLGGTTVSASGVSHHGDLTGLGDDDHTQYLLVNGTRAMTGALNMGSQNITNAGTINGVSIAAHASRHLPNGADPIATATAVGLSLSTVNAEGIQNSLARSDHTHAITGVQPADATLTALAAFNTNGLLTQTAADTFAARSISVNAGQLTVTNGNGVAGNPTLGLETTGVGAGTYGQVTVDTFGRVTAGATAAVSNGGTGLSALGTANQVLGVNAGASALEYKTLTAGTGISVTHGAGSVTIASTVTGTVTSVALSAPNIFSVGGSPVTTSGTLALTLANQSANTHFAGPASGGAAAPTFRTISLAQNDLSDVVISAAASGQVLSYDSGTSKWVNSSLVGANASGLIGAGQSGAAAWTFVSGTRYHADFAHNLGTTNIVITLFDSTTNTVVQADSIVLTDANTVRITVIGNSRTLKVVVVANGNSIVAGGSTPSSVVTAQDGVTVSTAATKLDFIGQAVKVADAGSGTTTVTFGSRFSYVATSLDSPNNSNWAVNALAVTTVDPTHTFLTVRSFSDSTEQGIGFTCSIPPGATTMTLKMRGRAQTAPGVASVVQPRLYHRAIPNNSGVGAWSVAQELANIAIPTNANFQYSTQAVSLASLGLTADRLYVFEITRRVSGVTGTNLAGNFLLAELVVEFA